MMHGAFVSIFATGTCVSNLADCGIKIYAGFRPTNT